MPHLPSHTLQSMLEDAKRDVEASDLALWTVDQIWADSMMYGVWVQKQRQKKARNYMLLNGNKTRRRIEPG